MKKGFVRGALLLLLAMLLSLLAACSSTAPETPSDGTIGTETETETGTDTGTEEPSAPVPVIENGEARFSIVFDENAQQETKDSVTSLYQAMKKKVTGTLDVASSDAITYDAGRQEILVGRISYPESEAALSRIGYGDWIIAMVGSKLVVNSYNRAAMVTAISELVQVLKSHTAGDGSVSLPSDFVMTDTRDAASDTIPAFFEGYRVDAYGEGQETGLAVVREADADSYHAYLEKLQSLGYTEYTTNAIGGNLFATYCGTDTVLTVGYYPAESAIRITSDCASALPPRASDNQWTKADGVVTSLAQIGLGTEANENAYNGMAYCYQLADGSFLVIDGGFTSDAERLYRYMKSKAPDGKIVIAAWFVTHNDGDHRQCLTQFASVYREDVTLELVVRNFPDAYTHAEANTTDNVSMEIALRGVPGCRVVKGHTGQKFYLRNAVVEILYSLDNYLPEVLSIFNNSSLVFSVEAEGERAIFMGDASDEAAKILKDNYGTLLRCDILQLAHHGLRNGHGTKMPNTIALYQLMRPEVVLWPSTEEHYLTSAEGDIKYSIGDFAWNKEALKSARECYLAGNDRILVLELPYRAFSAYDFNPDDHTQGTTAKEHPSGSGHLDYRENGDTLTVDWND